MQKLQENISHNSVRYIFLDFDFDFEDNDGEYDDHYGIGGENWLQIVTRGTLKYCDLWNIDDGTEA